MTDPVEINGFLRSMQTDQEELRQLVTRMMWHMRGGLSRQEAWTLSPDERKDIIKLIEEHRELTEKTGMPLL
jgi:hypothetical protein